MSHLSLSALLSASCCLRSEDGSVMAWSWAWFESYVLCVVFLDSSLESPGQEKHFGILFIPLCVVVRDEIQLSVET